MDSDGEPRQKETLRLSCLPLFQREDGRLAVAAPLTC